MWRSVLTTTGCALALVAPSSVAVAGTTEVQAPAAASISKAQAKKLAKAALVKARDLPGYECEANTAEPTDAADEAALYACLGVKVPKYAAENLGATYSSGAVVIDSASSVVATVKAARKDFKAVTSKKAAGCFKQQFENSLERDGFEVESLSVKKVPVTIAGADGAFAYRYSVRAGAEGQHVHLIGYQLGVLVGQVEFQVSPARFDGAKPSLKQSRKVAAGIVKRVRNV